MIEKKGVFPTYHHHLLLLVVLLSIWRDELCPDTPRHAGKVEKSLRKTFDEVADQAATYAAFAFVDCSDKEVRKMCKKNDLDPTPVVLAHFLFVHGAYAAPTSSSY